MTLPKAFELHPGSRNDEPVLTIPSRGLGTFDPAGSPPDAVYRSVLSALKVGYRHIDTALRYDDGESERQVGRAIRDSGIAREEIFVVTKLWNTFHDPKDVPVGMDMSLKNLGLQYVDLYLMHFPYAYKRRAQDFEAQRHENKKPVIDIGLSRAFDKTWYAMEQLVHQRKAKAIGVSNFSTPKLKRLLQSARIRPAVNQIEVHPHWPQKQLVKFCQDSGIHVTAFGPLGCAPVPLLIGRKDGFGPLDDPKIAAIAAKYGRSPAQIMLAWLISRDMSVVPKSSNEKRIAENFDCLFDLGSADITEIDNLVGSDGTGGVRNLDSQDYLGFDNYNEDEEEP